MSNPTDRFVKLIDLCTNESRRFKELELMSGIPATSWRKAYHGGQRPTYEMLQALSLQWPQHAYWLVSGLTDNEASHTSPEQTSVLDAAYQSRPAGTEALLLKAKLYKLLSEEQSSSSLVNRWEDWLTAHQEKYSKKLPWLYSVHPKLAKRKEEKFKEKNQRETEINNLIQQLDLSRKHRIAEFLTIYDSQKD